MSYSDERSSNDITWATVLESVINISYSSSSLSKTITLRLKSRFNIHKRSFLTHFHVTFYLMTLSLYLLPRSIVIPCHFIGFDKYLKFSFILLTVELSLSLLKWRRWNTISYFAEEEWKCAHINTKCNLMKLSIQDKLHIKVSDQINIWRWQPTRHDKHEPVFTAFFFFFF